MSTKERLLGSAARVDAPRLDAAPSRRLPTPEAAEYLGLAPVTLEKDRLTGELGIPYIKIGRAVRYDTGDLDAFLVSRRRMNTSEAPRAA